MNPTPPTLPTGWSEAWLEALSDAALKRQSSAAIFQRGTTYATSGAVVIVSETPPPTPALSAQVHGTETYAVEVQIVDDAVAGLCNCRSADDGWFCKHQVALALVWRAKLTGREIPVDDAARKKVAAAAKRANTVKEKRQALHDFLHAQDPAALANKLLELADLDSTIARELQQWRKLCELRDKPAELKPLITEILAVKGGFIGYHESREYARRGEAVLTLLSQARAQQAKDAVALCIHALNRIWNALSMADDSNGEIGGLCHAIGGELVATLKAAGEQPARFGDTYLQLQLDDPFGCFDTEAIDAVIGTAALTRFRQQLALRWRAEKDAALAEKATRAGKGGRPRHALFEFANSDATKAYQMRHLEQLHIAQLEKMGDVDAALAVLSEDLSSGNAYRDVVLFLEKHHRYREALTRAEQGYAAFPKDRLLEDAVLRGYERDGWTQEALALRHKQFDRDPGVQRYHDVLAAGKAAGLDTAALRQHLLDKLNAREEASRQASSPATRNVSLRAEILGSEGRWLEAYALVQAPAVCHVETLQRIAKNLPASHQEQALELLLRAFGFVMPRASNPYADALALVEEIAKRMAPARRAAWLAELRAQYKAKRNFVRDLPG